MASRVPKPILTLALLAAGVLFVRGCWPSEEERIQRLLGKLARDASAPARGQALADLATANRVADYFAPDFQIAVSLPGVPEVAIGERGELVQAVLAVKSRRPGITVELLDPRLVELGATSAVMDATAKAQSPGEPEPSVGELRFSLEKTEARWRVRKIENLRMFE